MFESKLLSVSWTPEQVQAVWNRGIVMTNNDPTRVGQDVCRAWIVRNEHGNRQSEYGWEIDHIDPNGGDELENLRPLHWDNNASRQDGQLTCPVIANGIHNIRRFPRQ